MCDETEGSRIWVVDRLDYWRTFEVDTLAQAGFTVEAYDRYEELPGHGETLEREPDLVVLGCARSQAEECRLITELAHRGCRVLIFSSTVSCEDARVLFLAGASDVVPRPDSPDLLLSVIRSDLASLAQQRRQPRIWSEASL